MNKLKTWNDGSYMPVWQKDLEFIQDAFKTPFVKLCETLLGATSGIICGCRYSNRGAMSTITEGLVLLDGEIVYCPAQSVQGNLDALLKVVMFDDSGDKVFKINDGTEVRQTYYTPQAILSSRLIKDIGPGNESSMIILSGEGKNNLITRLFEEMYERGFSRLMSDDFATLYGKGLEELFGEEIISISTNPNATPHVSMSYKKVGNVVFVLALSGQGAAQGGGGDNGVGGGSGVTMNKLIYTIPSGWRPAADTYFTYHENSTGNVALGVINTTGKIFVQVSTEITAAAFCFLIP